MTRILVLGREGQLARSIAASPRAAGIEISFAGRDKADLSVRGQAADLITSLRPDLVINAAAYTAVDKAESEPELAMTVNGEGPGEAAAAAARTGAGFIHISTDYVFDGMKPAPYVEDDPTGPAGSYGRSKLVGELAVLAAHPGATVFRTSWVYAPFGANFVRTMLRLAESRDTVRVVADQQGNPTSALHLAEALLDAAARGGLQPGVFHLAGTGFTTWCDFAREVFAASRALGGPWADVVPISTDEYPTPARRPANSRLDCSKAERLLGLRLPPWQDGVKACVAELLSGKDGRG